MTREEIIAKIEEMNKALSDEEMAMASGGTGEPTNDPKYPVGSRVYFRGGENLLGEGVVEEAKLNPILSKWYYAVYFAKVDYHCTDIPETKLYSA